MIDDRTEWLEWRRAGIGASDVAGILGLSPWASPYSVWYDKTFGGDDGQSEAMKLGLALEPAIEQLFHQETGLYVVGAQTRVQHPDFPWARATLDGYASPDPKYDDNGVPLAAYLIGTVQSKTTADSVSKWEDGIPLQYSCQVQWEMFVTGSAKAYVPTIHASFGLKFRVYEVDRDDDDIAYIFGKVREFYENHVLTGVPPATDGLVPTTDALSRIPSDPGAVIEVPELATTFDQLSTLKAQRDSLDEQIAAAENQIKAAMGECTEAVIGDRTVATWRTQERTTFDRKAWESDYPDLTDLYLKKSSSRVFRPVTKKEK